MKAIAIDFDGCLCADAYPEIGAPNWEVIAKAKQEQEAGAGLILWTCREGQRLQEAVEACEGWGLHFDAVNESLPSWIEAFGTAPRKVGATEYWDDKSVHMPPVSQPTGWVSVEERLPAEELKRLQMKFPNENEIEVIVHIQGAKIATTLYFDGNQFVDEFGQSYRITHWATLPEPPKGEEDA